MLLEQNPGSLRGRECEEAPTSVRAHPDLLFLNHLTLQAITRGAVVLPNGHRLHGGSWLRMVRALIDELRLTMPTLWMVGERDPVARYADDGILDHADDATFVRVPEAGHFLPEELPELVVERTLEHLS